MGFKITSDEDWNAERVEKETDVSPGEERIQYRQQKLGIQFGMSKEEAFERFGAWREKIKTCHRCEGEKYMEYCPIHLICKEVDNEQRNVTGDDYRGGVFEIDESEALRADVFKTRKRASLR